MSSQNAEPSLSAALSHLAIAVTDLERSAQFYEQVFGFKRAERSYVGRGSSLEQIMELPAAHIEGLFLAHGSFLLELLAYRSSDPSARVPHAPDAIGLAHLSFVVDDIDSCFKRAQDFAGSARAASRTAIPFGGGGPVIIAFVTDPDGNRIELIEHPDDEARAAHGRFLGADSFRWPPELASGPR